MDVAVFRSLKSAWAKNITNWRIDNNGVRLKREDFAPIVKTAITATITKEMVANGFRKCGLFPFNENAINYDSFLKSSEGRTSPKTPVTTSPQAEAEIYFLNQFEMRLGRAKLETFKQSPKDWNGDIKDENLFYYWTKIRESPPKPSNKNNTSSDLHLGDSTFLANHTFNWENDIIVMDMVQDVDHNMSTEVGDTTVEEIFEKILLLDITPKKQIEDLEKKIEKEREDDKENTKNTTKEKFPTPFKKCFVWPNSVAAKTATDSKNIKKKLVPTVAIAPEFLEQQRRLEEEQQQKQQKTEDLKKKREEKLLGKAKLTERRKKTKQINPVEKRQETISQGDHVLVSYEGQKYPGVVLKIKQDGFKIQYKVKTMSMSNVINGRINWRWPARDDVFDYDCKDVIKKIRPPKKFNNRGVFSVEDY